jgi:hypothetical protein
LAGDLAVARCGEASVEGTRAFSATLDFRFDADRLNLRPITRDA